MTPANPAAQLSPEPTIAETLAQFAADLRFEDVPGEVIARAKLHILDTLGTALAGASFDFAEPSLAGVQALSAGETEGRHPVIGMATRLPLRDAVLMNGILAHGLDYLADALHAPLKVGESTVLLKKAGGRKNHMGLLVRFIDEQVLADDHLGCI